jgi:hypothetical protein
MTDQERKEVVYMSKKAMEYRRTDNVTERNRALNRIIELIWTGTISKPRYSKPDGSNTTKSWKAIELWAREKET